MKIVLDNVRFGRPHRPFERLIEIGYDVVRVFHPDSELYHLGCNARPFLLLAVCKRPACYDPLGVTGDRMKRFVEGTDRGQSTLFPECLDDWIDENNPVRVIDAFVDTLDLAELGFEEVDPAETGRPAYHPSVLLKLYVYGYFNRVQSSRWLERQAARNVELMWLLGRVVPDHKTVADFRRDNGRAIRKVCARFVELCDRWVSL